MGGDVHERVRQGGASAGSARPKSVDAARRERLETEIRMLEEEVDRYYNRGVTGFLFHFTAGFLLPDSSDYYALQLRINELKSELDLLPPEVDLEQGKRLLRESESFITTSWFLLNLHPAVAMQDNLYVLGHGRTADGVPMSRAEAVVGIAPGILTPLARTVGTEGRALERVSLDVSRRRPLVVRGVQSTNGTPGWRLAQPDTQMVGVGTARDYQRAWARLAIQERTRALRPQLRAALGNRGEQCVTVAVGARMERGRVRLWFASSSEVRDLQNLLVRPRGQTIAQAGWGERLLPCIPKYNGSTLHHGEQNLMHRLKDLMYVGATKPICPHCAAMTFEQGVLRATRLREQMTGPTTLQAFLDAIDGGEVRTGYTRLQQVERQAAANRFGLGD